jgi:hypothetical protein
MAQGAMPIFFCHESLIEQPFSHTIFEMLSIS